MKKTITHKIENDTYAYLVTVLFCDVMPETELSKITLRNCGEGKKVLVDLALRTGLNSYRFGEYDVGSDGKILTESGIFAKPGKDLEELANAYLREKKDILLNSMLPDKAKAKLMKAPRKTQVGDGKKKPVKNETREPALV